MEKNQALPPLPTLPMHLMLAMGTWLASPFALNTASEGLPHWKNNSGQKNLQKALADEAKNRASELLSGISRYLETPYSRDVKEPPVIWNLGNARLLDYGQAASRGKGGAVLFIPSLINKYYILDLEKDRSFMRFLASQGAYPLVLDWGVPGKQEAAYGIDDYIKNILLPAIDFIHQATGQKVALAGYCMGGVLALAAAQLKPKSVNKLALFATPWNFHCQAFKPLVVEKPWRKMIDSMIGKNNSLPAEFIQSLFYITDPWIFEQKFRRFVAMDPKSRSAHDFVALEHWVNDGVAMTAGVARDCLIGWAQKNQLMVEGWRLMNKKIDPKKLNMPAFIAIPKNDHVVPYDCALPLAQMIQRAHIVKPSSGHVGMMVGAKARQELWAPFAEWLSRSAT